jgi:hypothetical protein
VELLFNMLCGSRSQKENCQDVLQNGAKYPCRKQSLCRLFIGFGFNGLYSFQDYALLDIKSIRHTSVSVYPTSAASK